MCVFVQEREVEKAREKETRQRDRETERRGRQDDAGGRCQKRMATAKLTNPATFFS